MNRFSKIQGDIVRSTDKAKHIRIDGQLYWIPNSQYKEEQGDKFISEWLCVKRNIPVVIDKTDLYYNLESESELSTKELMIDAATVVQMRSCLMKKIKDSKVTTDLNTKQIRMYDKTSCQKALKFLYGISAVPVEPVPVEPAVHEEPVHEEPVPVEPVHTDLAQSIASAVEKYIKPDFDLDAVIDKVETLLDEENKKIDIKLKELEKKVSNVRPIVVKKFDGKTENLGIQHEVFRDVLTLATDRRNMWLIGPSGSGKTHLMESVAQAMNIPFYTISVGLQTSKTDLFGYMDANGNFVESMFYRAYVTGGLFLLDEADNGNANVLAMVNAATSNSLCAFPNGMQKRHNDFIFCAAANTYGLGADTVYVGRNQIDGATRNRFAFIVVDYDENLESALCDNTEWLSLVRRVRKAVLDLNEKVIVSPRASICGARDIALGFDTDTCLDRYIFQGVNEDVRYKILQRAEGDR
jgi:MoxR-like ATPase